MKKIVVSFLAMAMIVFASHAVVAADDYVCNHPEWIKANDAVMKTGATVYVVVGEKPSWFDSQIGKVPTYVVDKMPGFSDGDVYRCYLNARTNWVDGVQVLEKPTSLIIRDFGGPPAYPLQYLGGGFGGCANGQCGRR